MGRAGLVRVELRAVLTGVQTLGARSRLQEEHHGDSGPLPVRRHTAAELVPVQAAFMEACRELGLPECADTNEPGKAGFGPHAMNKVDGRRISAAHAYLTAEVRARPNLHIRANTAVRRVVFEAKRAVGVEVEAPSGVERIEASAVILCGGAINTPGILLRSGVGPDREVRRLQCEPVLDAPAVGRRLLDHPGTGIFVLAKRGFRVDYEAPIIQTVYRFPSGMLDHRADMLLQPVSFTMMPRQPPLFAMVTQWVSLGHRHDALPRRGHAHPADHHQGFFENART